MDRTTFPHLIGQDIVESAVSTLDGIIIGFVNGDVSADADRLDGVPARCRQVPEHFVTKTIDPAIKGLREFDAL